MANHDVITIGASAGGVEALIKLVAGLPADLPASVFIVQHMAPESQGELAGVLGYRGVLPVELAADRREIEQSHIYVAPPDYHLMIDRSYMYVSHGPRENMTRPAIDPLFRSAAVERSLWVVVQMMDERVRTLERLSTTEQEKDRRRSAAGFHDRAAEIREHTERLRQLLLRLNQ